MLIEKTLRRTCWLQVILCLLLLCVGTMLAQAAERKNVLVIYSAGRMVPGAIAFDQAFRPSLNALNPSAEIYDEFLDVSRFPQPWQPDVFANYLREKYADNPPDVIVAASDMAMRFVVLNRHGLFTQTPVVYINVLETTLAELAPLGDNIIGDSSEPDFVATIVQALRWHPQTRHLVLVTGSSAWDKIWERKLRNSLPPLPAGVEVEYFSGLPAAQLQQQLRQLSRDSLVFSPGFFRDGAGRNFIPRDSSQFISEATSVPYYGPFPTHIGTGIIGGFMIDWASMGKQAAFMVNQFLQGTTPDMMKLPEKLQSVMHVDWNQAQHWGIAEADFPPGTVVHFSEPSLLQAHGKELTAVLLLVLLQAALIGGLLFERRRRRLAEQAIQVQSFELAHASRLAIAGELTGSIAHEINQPLGAILSNAETAVLLMQSETPDLTELRQIMADIRRDDLRASQVIKHLRALLEKHEHQRALMDVNESLEDVAGLLRAEAHRRKVSLEFTSAANPLKLLGDRVQIQQVLINLILNAMDAVAVNPEEQRKVMVNVDELGGRTFIRVEDYGHGIAVEHLPHVFDSFFTRKQTGMGLGLSIVKTIVEAHGGTIRVENTSPSGSVFCVELPAAGLPAQEPV